MAERCAGLRVRALVALTAAVVGCTPVTEAPERAAPPATAPVARPEVAHSPSARSLAISARLERVEAGLRAQGLLRTDGGGTDTPFNARMLARNFEQIALYDEYTPVAGVMVPQVRESRLRRWEAPVRLALEFGASVPDDRRAGDRAEVRRLVDRLGRATGHPMSVVADPGEANFHVLVLDEDERRAITPRLEALLPGISRGATRTIVDMNPGTFCLVFAFSRPDSYAYTRAIAVVRAEHPDLMRLACYHEEIAQGLGLANDSPGARPSIFNDDEEFALLTRHDALLLRILYDDRLSPGMDAAEARPIVDRIARGLFGGES